MMNKEFKRQVILNWVDISDWVKEIEQLSPPMLNCMEVRSDSTTNFIWKITYKNGRITTLWLDDIIVINLIDITPKPKYKIGDNVVVTTVDYFIWIKIYSITFNDNLFKYNMNWEGGYYNESRLRKPTQEELELYFN